MFHRFLEAPPKVPTPLKPVGSWSAARHHWEETELRALAAAGFSGRPLLVKGEPGVGKSQLARAAAALLEWHFDYEVITPRLEPQDLLWRFDAVRRLASAHRSEDKGERDFVTPGVLWRALQPGSVQEPGCVVLLDEIDKADSEVPNTLLEVMGNRAFTLRFDGQEEVVPPAGILTPPLLVIVTSNDERELPLAFMRRCVVLEMPMPDERAQAAFCTWLVRRGQAQFPHLNKRVLAEAAELVRRDRADSLPGQGARPGLAEFQDLLRAVDEITGGRSGTQAMREQCRWLTRLSPYMLRKQPGQGQHAALTTDVSEAEREDEPA